MPGRWSIFRIVKAVLAAIIFLEAFAYIAFLYLPYWSDAYRYMALKHLTLYAIPSTVLAITLVTVIEDELEKDGDNILNRLNRRLTSSGFLIYLYIIIVLMIMFG